MRYFIDCEFDGYRGPLITMALVREDGRSLYFQMAGAAEAAMDPWVIENVLPIIKDSPEQPFTFDTVAAAGALMLFLQFDPAPMVTADWPDDLRHLCDLLVYAPGKMIAIPGLRMEVVRVDAYPSTLPAVQHNAWWDAVALQAKIEADEEAEARTAFAR